MNRSIIILIFVLFHIKFIYSINNNKVVAIYGSIVITGDSLNDPKILAVEFSGPPAQSIQRSSFTSINSTTIVIPIQPYMLQTQWVTLCSGTTSNCLLTQGLYSYLIAPPYLTSWPSFDVGTTVVNFTGYGLVNTADIRPASNILQVSKDGLNYSMSVSYTNGASVIIPPNLISGAGYSIDIFKMNGQLVLYPPGSTFSFNPPKITSIDCSNGVTCTITGSSFGIDMDKLVITILIKNRNPILVNLNTVKSSSLGSVTISIPSSFQIGGLKSVNLKLNGVSGNIYPFMINPVISSISSCPFTGGVVTIGGSYLNVTDENGSQTGIQILIGGVGCTNPSSNGVVLTCTMPAGKGTTTAIISITDTTSNSFPFTFGVPEITNSAVSGNQLTVNGKNLGDSSTTFLIFQNNPIKYNVVIVNGGTQSTATLPPAARNGLFYISSSGVNSTATNIVLTPNLTSVTMANTTGSVVTITGQFICPLDTSGNPLGAVININGAGSQQFNCTNPQYVSDGITTCVIPVGVGTGYTLSMSMSGKTSNGISFSYLKPVIVSFYQQFNEIHLVGYNFGDVNQPIQVPFQGKMVDSVHTIPHDELMFIIEDDAKDGSTFVTVGGQISNSIQVSIHPSIRNITVPSTSGGEITISGYFFNTNETKDINFTVAGVSCTNLTIQSTRQFTCMLSEGCGANHSISLTVRQLDNAEKGSLYLSYKSPTVESSTTTDQNGGLVTIRGSNFYPNSTNITIGAVSCTTPDIYQYNLIICYLFPWNFKSLGEIPNTPQDVVINVGGQIASNNTIFSYQLEGLYAERELEANQTRLKWLIPAIVLPAAAGLTAFLAVAIILLKKHQKMKKLQAQFRK